MTAAEENHRCPDCNRPSFEEGLCDACLDYPNKYPQGLHEDPLHDDAPNGISADELRHEITCDLVSAIGDVPGWKLDPDPRRVLCPRATMAVYRNPERGSIEVYVGDKHVIVTDPQAPLGTTRMFHIRMLGLHSISDRIGGIIRYGIIGS